MAYIVSQIVVCLLLAASIGFLIGWFLVKSLRKEKENLYIYSLKQDIKDKDDEWYRLKALLVNCEKREKALENEIKKQQEDHSLMDELKEEIKRLHSAIDAKNEEIENLKNSVDGYKELENSFEELKKSCEEEKEAFEKELHTSNAKLKECKESLFALNVDKPQEIKAEIIIPEDEKKNESFLAGLVELIKRHLNSKV